MLILKERGVFIEIHFRREIKYFGGRLLISLCTSCTMQLWLHVPLHTKNINYYVRILNFYFTKKKNQSL